MNSLLNIPSSFKTPEIQMNALTGVLKISGRVFPENPKEFFGPIMNWMNEYIRNPAEVSSLVLNLSYFNSSSNEYIFRCCKMLEALGDSGASAGIIWEYEAEDEDMRQMGEDFKELLKINFEIKAVH
jgi:SiaC family regulatory phosphoprotein